MPRKEKKYHFIYKTTNTLSGRYYIGMHSTDNLDDGYLGSGTRLRYSINKYGKENHNREILEFCKSREVLKKREGEIVNLNEIAKVDCINLKVGGYGGFTIEQQRMGGLVTSTLLRERFKNDIEYRGKMIKTFSDTAKKTHGEGKIKTGKDAFDWTGKNHSEETKLKISEAKKGQGQGQYSSQYGTRWITNEIENKKISKDDLIPEGWRLGRLIKNTIERGFNAI